MSVSKRLRYEVFRRDNHACRYCGASAPDVRLVVDHVVPCTLGGGDQPANLVTACAECNSGKSATPPNAAIVQDVEQDAIRWARAMTLAQQMQMEERDRVLDYVGAVEAAWTEWVVKPSGAHIPLPEDWQRGVETFYRFDINLSEWRTAIRKAMTHRKVATEETWRYTCGILWSMLRDRTEIARRILAEGGDL